MSTASNGQITALPSVCTCSTTRPGALERKSSSTSLIDRISICDARPTKKILVVPSSSTYFVWVESPVNQDDSNTHFSRYLADPNLSFLGCASPIAILKNAKASVQMGNIDMHDRRLKFFEANERHWDEAVALLEKYA